MTSTSTPWTKTGVTAREITARVSGPSSLKSDLIVPQGTAVRFIGHWVVADLGWLAKREGEAMKAAFPTTYRADKAAGSLGLGTVVYHDADHYGITVLEADVTDVKAVNVESARRRPRA